MPDDKPEYLRGRLKFYWVDAGAACGLVVVNAGLDVIVDCAPYWRKWWIGRGLEEVCEWNPEARVRKLPDTEGWRKHGQMTEKEKERLTRSRRNGRVTSRR